MWTQKYQIGTYLATLAAGTETGTGTGTGTSTGTGALTWKDPYERVSRN